MNFSVKTEYALRALCELAEAKDGKPMTRQFLSDKQNIPVDFLEHILISLKEAGIVRSVKGPGGGFTIDKEYSLINIWDVFQAVEKKVNNSNCYPGLKQDCNLFQTCKIKTVWTKLDEVIKTNLTQTSLAQLVGV